jgi:hypothetical protein
MTSVESTSPGPQDLQDLQDLQELQPAGASHGLLHDLIRGFNDLRMCFNGYHVQRLNVPLDEAYRVLGCVDAAALVQITLPLERIMPASMLDGEDLTRWSSPAREVLTREDEFSLSNYRLVRRHRFRCVDLPLQPPLEFMKRLSDRTLQMFVRAYGNGVVHGDEDPAAGMKRRHADAFRAMKTAQQRLQETQDLRTWQCALQWHALERAFVRAFQEGLVVDGETAWDRQEDEGIWHLSHGLEPEAWSPCLSQVYVCTDIEEVFQKDAQGKLQRVWPDPAAAEAHAEETEMRQELHMPPVPSWAQQTLKGEHLGEVVPSKVLAASLEEELPWYQFAAPRRDVLRAFRRLWVLGAPQGATPETLDLGPEAALLWERLAETLRGLGETARRLSEDVSAAVVADALNVWPRRPEFDDQLLAKQGTAQAWFEFRCATLYACSPMDQASIGEVEYGGMDAPEIPHSMFGLGASLSGILTNQRYSRNPLPSPPAAVPEDPATWAHDSRVSDVASESAASCPPAGHETMKEAIAAMGKAQIQNSQKKKALAKVKAPSGRLHEQTSQFHCDFQPWKPLWHQLVPLIVPCMYCGYNVDVFSHDASWLHSNRVACHFDVSPEAAAALLEPFEKAIARDYPEVHCPQPLLHGDSKAASETKQEPLPVDEIHVPPRTIHGGGELDVDGVEFRCNAPTDFLPLCGTLCEICYTGLSHAGYFVPRFCGCFWGRDVATRQQRQEHDFDNTPEALEGLPPAGLVVSGRPSFEALYPPPSPTQTTKRSRRRCTCRRLSASLRFPYARASRKLMRAIVERDGNFEREAFAQCFQDFAAPAPRLGDLRQRIERAAFSLHGTLINEPELFFQEHQECGAMLCEECREKKPLYLMGWRDTREPWSFYDPKTHEPAPAPWNKIKASKRDAQGTSSERGCAFCKDDEVLQGVLTRMAQQAIQQDLAASDPLQLARNTRPARSRWTTGPPSVTQQEQAALFTTDAEWDALCSEWRALNAPHVRYAESACKMTRDPILVVTDAMRKAKTTAK